MPANTTAAATTPPRSMDMRRGGAPVVSARGTSARTLHTPPQPRTTKSMDMRGPAKRPRGTVVVPSEPVRPPARAAITAPPRHRQHDAAKVADRLERASTVTKSEHIARFHTSGRLDPADTPAVTPTPTPPLVERIPQAAVAAHEGLKRLIPPATNPVYRSTPKWTQYAAVAAAIAVMAGYVWVQNYPKMTIQSAANKAGVVATNPSYLPTSYNLAGAVAAPGLLTLNFKSPSQPTALTINQAKTSWDTQSLADNFVAKTDPAYSSVNGQGLTIYLYGQNDAAWVNHGIWYTIKGTARLSRDEVLKIAYGL